MKNLINFYAAILLPLLSLCLLAKNGLDSNWFVGLLRIYAFLYHLLISGIRLMRMGIINEKKLIYCFVPRLEYPILLLAFSKPQMKSEIVAMKVSCYCYCFSKSQSH